jgi:organic hydroperoxide reductase OsmC/OhrA
MRQLKHARLIGTRNAAHQICPYSNATRGNIDVTITVSDD